MTRPLDTPDAQAVRAERAMAVIVPVLDRWALRLVLAPAASLGLLCVLSQLARRIAP